MLPNHQSLQDQDLSPLGRSLPDQNYPGQSYLHQDQLKSKRESVLPSLQTEISFLAHGRL